MAEEKIRFTIHGLTSDNGFVRADVFAKKLSAFVAAAKVEDTRLNGKAKYGLMIRDLKIGSADAWLDPKLLKRATAVTNPIPAVARVAESVQNGVVNFDESEVAILKKLAGLSEGANTTHSHVEIDFGQDIIVRVDDFFASRANRAIAIAEGSVVDPARYFEGASVGQFDGTIKAIDSRGAKVRGKIVLTVDGSELDCTFRRDDLDTVLSEYEHRSRIEGLAIYDGRQRRPVRVDVRRLIPIKPGNLLRWAGKLTKGRNLEWVSGQ